MVKTIDSERLKIELLGTQRWEDEGGQIIEAKDASPAPMFVRRPAPGRVRRRVTTLRWNERFIIQPFRPGIGMLLISEKQEQ